ncbi:MAG: hypothetical protein RLZZ262_2467 [Bacteroidota bacterium]|jgi:tetratricopeptide (TPR) repeat protein
MKPLYITIPTYLSFLFVFVFILIVGCSQQKALMAEAVKLETAGMLQSAFQQYQSIHQQYQNVDASVGMHRVSQQMLNKKCNEAVALCMSDQHDLGLVKFQEAKAFYQSHQNLEITFPANTEFQIQECKKNYIESLLKQAEAAALNMELTKAEQFLNKVEALDYDNAPAKALALIIRILPIYKEGQAAYELGLWRKAYDNFNQVCQLDIAYRDAKSKRDDALKNGQLSMAYVNKNGTAPEKVMASLASNIKGEILNLKNPFIELLERTDLEVLIKEQQNTLSAEFDSENGPEAGKFRRASFLLYGEVIAYKSNLEPERIIPCDCGSTMNIYSDKVICSEYNQRRTVEIAFRYQLVDAETGKIFMADVIQQKAEDVGKRYDFEITKKISLMSPTLNKNHDVDLTSMKKPKEDYLISDTELSEMAINAIAKEIAKRLADFNP